MIDSVEYLERYEELRKIPHIISISVQAGIYAKCFEYTREGKNLVLDAILANGAHPAHDAAIANGKFGHTPRHSDDAIVIFSGGTSVCVSKNDPETSGEWRSSELRPDGVRVIIIRRNKNISSYANILYMRIGERLGCLVRAHVLALEHAKVYLQQSSYPDPVGEIIRQAFVKMIGTTCFQGSGVDKHCEHIRLRDIALRGHWDRPPVVAAYTPTQVVNMAYLDINDWEGASYEMRCIEGMRFDRMLPFVSAVVLPNGDI